MTNALDVICIASFNADLVSRVARPIAKGETLTAHSFEIQPGGKGSNAAVAAARQGARVGVVARIGDDDFGRMAMQLWQVEGLDVQHVAIAPNEYSGVAQILVFEDGDNSIAVATGAGAGLNQDHIQAAARMIQSAKVVMASNEVPFAATKRAFIIANSVGVTTVLNPAPAIEIPLELLAYCDVLTPNEDEVRLLAGLAPDAEIQDAAMVLLKKGVEAVIVTLGAKGCHIFMEDDAKPARIAGHRVTPVVDTIGAGDTFTGALAAALARGESLRDAASIANAAAALSVTGKGAIAAMPTLAQSRYLHGTAAAAS